MSTQTKNPIAEIALLYNTTNWGDAMLETEQEQPQPVADNKGFSTPKQRKVRKTPDAPKKGSTVVHNSLHEVKKALTFEEKKVNYGNNHFATLADDEE